MKLAIAELLDNAFAGMTRGPAPLMKAITFYAEVDDVGTVSALAEKDLLTRLSLSPNDETRRLFHTQLKRWDWEPDAPWANGTTPNSQLRRVRIYELLQIAKKLQTSLDEHVPPYIGLGNTLVDDPASKGDWYTFEFRSLNNFYSKQVRKYLEAERGLADDSLSSLEASTIEIMERLADPSSVVARGTRGLIVGYVQSGKTTNFTSVIAKAIDAGYRLIIVLSGTTNMLRNQTQRRLDMGLIGVENILRGAAEDEVDHDYKQDRDWPGAFISYGKRPSVFGKPDITRLTSQQDFRSHDAGINPLEFEFEKKNRQLPLFHRENLDHAGARIAVVKKNTDRLRQLVKELKAVGTEKCAEIPALIIDDESDQASINTMKPGSQDDKTRQSINKFIVDLLRKLPRAQYLGYTATPIANVFVNPKDPEDIYPKDFIMSLDRPIGYMGASEFHDFDVVPSGRLSNEEAFVRGVPKKDQPQQERLSEAIDAFVLTAAIKKFREAHGSAPFKHHTMLVHQSASRQKHRVTAEVIRKLWKEAGYDAPGPTTKRLQELLGDFRKVWLDRGKSLGLAFPNGYNELKPALGAALSEIRRGDPVLMVNSDRDADEINFDQGAGVWKIVVGGAKLSRGFTIEGLTVSYFRRAAKLQDTLMQMGRWFGFRAGYEDLVRLYIGRVEPVGKKNTLDLYKAFEGMCRDEEDFRAQLSQYSRDSGITPKDVPALVFNSYPQLRPTAKNKMWHAEVTQASFTYREPTSQAVSANGLRTNAQLFRKLILNRRITSDVVQTQKGGEGHFDVKWWKVSNKEVVNVLEAIAWGEAGSPINAEISYLRENRPVASWLMLLPQVGKKAEGGMWLVGSEEFSCIRRERFETRFNVYSSPAHVLFAKWLVEDNDNKMYLTKLRPNIQRGVFLLYPTKAKNWEASAIPAMGFGIAIPSKSNKVVFRVKM